MMGANNKKVKTLKNKLKAESIAPQEPFFVIKALSGACLKVNQAKLVKPYHYNFPIEKEAAVCLPGDSPPSEKVRLRIRRMTESSTIEKAFFAFYSELNDLILTKAQIREFSCKYVDYLKKQQLTAIALFDIYENNRKNKKELLAAMIEFDNKGLHISLAGLNKELLSGKLKGFLLVAPLQEDKEHIIFMLEEMDIWREAW